MKELRIAGGGLAGLGLAAGLRLRGVPVRVDEAGRYPRHRVCGEFISGVSAATLGRLGIAGLFDDALRHRSLRWFVGGRPMRDLRLPEPALGISRFRLDLRLRDRVVGLGGLVSEGTRAAPEAAEGLVWAAGRAAAPGSWIGLKCHLTGLATEADLEMHIAGNGYVGLAGVEGGRVNACGLFRVDRGLRGGRTGLLGAYLRAGGLNGLAERIEAATIDASSCRAVAGFRLGRQPSPAGLCVIGDAQSMIPPFTGHGMSMALQAAEIALEPLEGWSRGELDWEECTAGIAERLRQAFGRRLLAARWLHPLLLHNPGRRLAGALGRSGLLPFRPLLSLVR